MTSPPSLALVTPSYAPDFERCRLLCQSRGRCWPDSVHHYVVVDSRDLPRFRSLANPTTEILAVEDILPWWIRRLPGASQGWVSFKTWPIRNWILQQLVKLAIAPRISQEVLVFVDSDVAFIRPVDPGRLVQGDRIRLYRNPEAIPRSWENFHRWYQSAARLLGLAPVSYPAPNFIGDLIVWRRDRVLQLHQHLESRFSRSWLEVLGNTWHWSEYILYGLFIEQVLGEQSGHYYDDVCPGLQYFSTEPMNDNQLNRFFAGIEESHIMVMISAKANIDPKRYGYLLNQGI